MKLSFLTKFSLVSLIIILNLGFFLGWGMTNYLKKSAINQKIEETSRLTHSIIDHHLRDQNFDKLSPAKFREIDKLVRGPIYNGSVLLVKIWNRRGEVIYS